MVAKSFLSAFSEIGDEGLAWHNLAPSMIRPIMDIGLNKSWTGGMIHTQPDWQKAPNAESGFRFTPETWKDIAKFLNNHSGGTPRHSGYLDLYPEDVEYLMKSYFGGQERPIEDAADIVTALKRGEPLPLTKIPIGSIFYGTDYDKADQAAARERKFDSKHPWMAPAR
jgi:hypothetical protein